MSSDAPDLREATPLAARSTGSLLRGRVDAGTWAHAFAAGGYRSAALADRDGLYTTVRFLQACHEHGVRPIVGTELSAGRVGKAGAAEGDDGPAVALALARNRSGYAALCRLLTARHLAPERAWDDVCAEALAGGDAHLIALTDAAAESVLARCHARGFDPRSPLTASAHDGALPLLWRGVDEPRAGSRAFRAALA
ncbi:MAG: PHP domain-containing protein, partial [Candidatus Eiseniibacteriota bacterium]